MAAETRRGCGFRKVGGLYMVSGQLSAPCGRLPLELHVCPTCKSGIKQSRGWTWVNAAALLSQAHPCKDPTRRARTLDQAVDLLVSATAYCMGCPASPLNLEKLGEQTGLIWVGGSFYPEAADFMREAELLGVSRRIPAIPRGFKLGESWVLVAHPRAVKRAVPWAEATAEEQEAHALRTGRKIVAGNIEIPVVRKGVITLFKPTAIEKIVTATQAKDEAAMAELAERGITPVVVPDDDPDHQGSVYDKDDEEGQLPLGNGAAAESPRVAP